MKNGAVKGAFVLIVSGFVCKLFGAFFRLPLTNIIGIEGIGAFQMVMSLYSLMLVLVTGGVTTSLSRLVSSARARGDYEKISGFLRIALYITISISVVLGLVFFLLARNISSVQGIAEGYFSYRLLIILLPLGALIGVFRGIIQGYENMTPTAISQILEQIIKFAFGLFFAFWLGKGSPERGVFGAFIGITISELVAAAYLLLYMMRKVKLPAYQGGEVIKPFLHAVVPLSLGGAVLPLTHAIDSMIIVSRLAFAGISAELATSLFGLQTGVVGAILNFPLIISLSVAMAILPKISYLSSRGDLSAQKHAISTSFSLMWFLLLPLAVGLMAEARLIYPIIYPTAINGFLKEAVNLTYIGGLSIILSAIMQFMLSILQAKGYYTFSFLATFLGGVVKVLIVIFTASIPAINIYAIPLSNIFLCIVICLMALVKLGGLIKIHFFNFFTPLLSAFIMFMVVQIIIKAIKLPSILVVVISIFVGGIIYLFLNFPIIKGLYSQLFGKNHGREEENE